jgi:hypothetical protein
MSRRFGAVSTDSITVTHYAAIDALMELSIFIRAFRTGAGGNNLGRYAAKASGTNNDWGWYNNETSGASNFDANRWATAGQWQSTQVALSDWNSEMWTYSFSSTTNVPKCYYQGVRQGTVTTFTTPSGALGAGTSDLTIGNNAASGVRVFAGDLADFAIWNRILSDGEAKLVHLLGPARVANGLVLYLTLDGLNSPEPNRAAANTGTVVGATTGRLVYATNIDRGRNSRFGV